MDRHGMCPVETVSKNSFSTLRLPNEGERPWELRRGLFSLRPAGALEYTRGETIPDCMLEALESSIGFVAARWGGFGTLRGDALRGDDCPLAHEVAFFIEFRSVNGVGQGRMPPPEPRYLPLLDSMFS